MSSGAGRSWWHGLVGRLDGVESASVLTTAAVSAAAVGLSTRPRAGNIRAAFLTVITFDLVGGLVAFQLAPTRKRYEESSVAKRLGFALVHVQPFALPLTGEGSWGQAVGRYASALAATGTLEFALPQHEHRRLVANALAVALSVRDWRLSTGSHQRWLGPVFLLKVVGGHAGIPRRSASA